MTGKNEYIYASHRGHIKITCSFVDTPWEKFTGNTAVQREISSSTKVNNSIDNKREILVI